MTGVMVMLDAASAAPLSAPLRHRRRMHVVFCAVVLLAISAIIVYAVLKAQITQYVHYGTGIWLAVGLRIEHV